MKKMTASFSVEASLIIPFMIMVILAIVILCIYWYDRSAVSSAVTLLAEERRLNSEAISETGYECLGKYPLVQNGSVRVQTGKGLLNLSNTLVLEADAKLQLPSKGLLSKLTQKMATIFVERRYEISNREQIQLCMSILMEKIKGRPENAD